MLGNRWLNQIIEDTNKQESFKTVNNIDNIKKQYGLTHGKGKRKRKRKRK